MGELFKILEQHKAELRVQEYSLSATTLEQIFNSFVRQQESTEQQRAAGRSSVRSGGGAAAQATEAAVAAVAATDTHGQLLAQASTAPMWSGLQGAAAAVPVPAPN